MKKSYFIFAFSICVLYEAYGRNPEPSVELSRKLSDAALGPELLKEIEEINFYFQESLSIAPLIDYNARPAFSIIEPLLIRGLLERFWRNGSDNPNLWSYANASLVMVVRFRNGDVGYFHIYLVKGDEILMSPYTGYDAATYRADSFYDLISLIFEIKLNQVE